jgi:phospholipid/cholesterol/gamma-HCH transport system permease protein
MFRELGPVLTGLMVAGRVGAAMSAEIGTMKVTQQIDALRALAVHPIDYLVVPRALAMLISMPLLVVECVGFGVLASYYVAVYVLNIEAVFSSTICRNSPRAVTSVSLIKGCLHDHYFLSVAGKVSTRRMARWAWGGPQPRPWSHARCQS